MQRNAIQCTQCTPHFKLIEQSKSIIKDNNILFVTIGMDVSRALARSLVEIRFNFSFVAHRSDRDRVCVCSIDSCENKEFFFLCVAHTVR